MISGLSSLFFELRVILDIFQVPSDTERVWKDKSAEIAWRRTMSTGEVVPYQLVKRQTLACGIQSGTHTTLPTAQIEILIIVYGLAALRIIYLAADQFSQAILAEVH